MRQKAKIASPACRKFASANLPEGESYSAHVFDKPPLQGAFSLMGRKDAQSHKPSKTCAALVVSGSSSPWRTKKRVIIANIKAMAE